MRCADAYAVSRVCVCVHNVCPRVRLGVASVRWLELSVMGLGQSDVAGLAALRLEVKPLC